MNRNQSHNHGHSTSSGSQRGAKLGLSILLNILITVAQVIGGLYSGSLALLSDALHNFSDVVSLIISYVADRLTKKEYTNQQTFGYKRAEIIAAFINSVTLIVVAVLIGKAAILRFNSPTLINSNLVIYLAFLSILVNGGSVLLLLKEKDNNLNMRSAYLHLFSDMITSVAVLLGGLAMKWWNLYWIDSAMSLGIALYLIFFSTHLFISTLKVLMQFAPDSIDLNELCAEVNTLPLIQSIHHVHLWQLNDSEIHLQAHLALTEDISLSQTCHVLESVEEVLRSHYGVKHIVLQPEFGMSDGDQVIIDESER